MKTIQTSAGKINIEEILKGIAQLKIPDFDDFRAKIEQLVKNKKPPSFLKKEKELIEKIRSGGPSKVWVDKYDRLSAKVSKECITEKEHNELLKMIPVSEKWAHKRLTLMIELAKLWDSSLDEVLKRLKIKPRTNIYV